MSDEMTEEDWERSVAEFFPRCPLCGSKSLEIDIKYGRRYDSVHCHNCRAEWEIDWKGENYEIESIELVKASDAEKSPLEGKKRKPEFWQRKALKMKGERPISKGEQPITKQVIKEKVIIIKIRCSYCKKLYDETLDVCPHCGVSG